MNASLTQGISKASWRRGALAAAASAGMAFAAPLAMAADTVCDFRAVGTLSLAFGTLDPSVGTTVIASLTGAALALQVGDCSPPNQTMSLSASNGMNFANGSRRLANGSNFIPYSLSANSAPWTSGAEPWIRSRPGNNSWTALPVITATILGADYQDAAAGPYTDTLTLTVTP